MWHHPVEGETGGGKMGSSKSCSDSQKWVIFDAGLTDRGYTNISFLSINIKGEKSKSGEVIVFVSLV